ncbi:hypothetical protein DL771_000063 [Monosporascus sp. 5C6A]|nr:hypothetical protein DL771_000063 [Monosporascus sp. 5C6A]
MTGFEIIGIVLGTIPIAVSLAEEYRKAIQAWRKYDREVKRLILRLKTEQNLLQSHCEKLLSGIVNHAEIEPMIHEPFGPLWKEQRINGMARQRLWKSYVIFEETVWGMQEAAEKLTKKLEFSSSLQTRRGESGLITCGLDRAKYMLRRSQYDELLKVIADGNATLEKLLNASIDPVVESSRRIRSEGRFFTLARDISRNVYMALKSSISCNCSVSHGVNLELLPPSVQPIPEDDDNLIVNKMFFRVALAYDPNDRKAKYTTWLWDEVELRVGRQESQRSSDIALTISKPSRKPRKRVQFAMTTPTDAGWQSQSQPTTITQPQMMGNSATFLPAAMASLSVGASLGMPNKTEQAPDLIDLCQTIERCQHRGDMKCYGYVSDPSAAEHRKFGVYPLRTYQDYSNWTTISLKDVLEDSNASLPPLRFRDRQKLAAIIASNVLQLSGTSWLPDILTSDDILFIKREDRGLYDQAFVAKRLPELKLVEPAWGSTLPTAYIHNRMLFSLGIILLEIALGNTLDSLRTPSEQPPAGRARDLLVDYKTADKYLDIVEKRGGENYGRAVRYCIECKFLSRNPSLDDDEFRQEVYGSVVAPLEENVRSMSADSKRFCQ